MRFYFSVLKRHDVLLLLVKYCHRDGWRIRKLLLMHFHARRVEKKRITFRGNENPYIADVLLNGHLKFQTYWRTFMIHEFEKLQQNCPSFCKMGQFRTFWESEYFWVWLSGSLILPVMPTCSCQPSWPTRAKKQYWNTTRNGWKFVCHIFHFRVCAFNTSHQWLHLWSHRHSTSSSMSIGVKKMERNGRWK